MQSQNTPTRRGRSRSPIPYDVQVRVLFRDGWICRWCHRPVVFGPALRLLQEFTERGGYPGPLAYFHRNWSRAGAPLLDHLGAVIDHVEAFAKGGAHAEGNFVVACNKCNTRKNSGRAEDYERKNPRKPVRGKYGEPQHWDGFASLFLVLAGLGVELMPAESQWERAIRKHLEILQAPPSSGLKPTAAGGVVSRRG